MEILVKRLYKKETYTIGKMYIDGEYVCDTVEDKNRGLSDDMDLEVIKAKKVYGKTAIPTGRYQVLMNVVSPKFSQKEFYMEVCKGKVPRLMNIKGFDGVLIHSAGSAEYVSGCVGVGYNKIKGGLTNIKEAFIKVYEKLSAATDDIYITIE